MKRPIVPADLVESGVLDGCRQATQRIGGAALTNLGVTSTLRGEGRTSIAAGLALVQWRDHGRRTVLIDLDLERPSLHLQLGLAAGPGLRELVDGRERLDDCLQRVTGELWLLAVGTSEDTVPRVLSRLANSPIMAQLAERADVLICDLPPLLGSSTGLDAARLCTSVAMVVRAGLTPMPRVREAAALLAAPPPVILNGTRSSLPSWLRRAMGDWA